MSLLSYNLLSETLGITNLPSSFGTTLKTEPYPGKPLGYTFFREKKFNGKRILFLVYEEHKCIFLITITDKKTQRKEIELIKENLEIYKEKIDALVKRL